MSASQPITLQRVLTVLEQGVVAELHGLLRWSSNDAYLLTVAYEDDTVLAVYKPQSGENPLWDFPNGSLCYRERAAFLTSQALGWEVVPPTVLREAEYGLGSVQFFVHHDPNLHYFTFGEGYDDQLQRICLFDIITNNADRKGGHCLLDEGHHIWGIDHGITFHIQPKLRTVIWNYVGQPIPAPLLVDVERLNAQLTDENSAYGQALMSLLSGGERRALGKRLQKLLVERCFPQPSPHGPHMPWPPV